ncbi:MAG TPA: site-specific integrase [Ktedonobacteraceae bacterium]|nr:site-specific integrase [Ktedonobacteraceae bacterium]
MGHRKGIIYAAIERFDGLMAIGESRHEAKQALRTVAEKQNWTLSIGKIHSHITRKVYQQHTLAFINWTRERYSITRLEQLDECADELASQYLVEQLAEGKSAYSVQTQRSALRMFFGRRDLAASVTIPARLRSAITRSRTPLDGNTHFQPEHWPELVTFAQATGLRRSELRDLRIRDVSQNEQGQLVVHVTNGKGGRSRDVPVLPGYEQHILAVIDERPPEERVFRAIPKHMNVHGYRRAFAQARYLNHAPEHTLPPRHRRLRSQDYDHEAAREVSRSLGHNRLDVLTRHYLR